MRPCTSACPSRSTWACSAPASPDISDCSIKKLRAAEGTGAVSPKRRREKEAAAEGTAARKRRGEYASKKKCRLVVGRGTRRVSTILGWER